MEKPVFSTANPRRWRGIKWTFRVSAFVLAFFAVVAVLSVLVPDKPALPSLFNRSQSYRDLLNNDSLIERAHQARRKAADNKLPMTARRFTMKHRPIPTGEHVRAGFFVNWDLQSYYSLRDHADQLNMVLPEWSFVGDNTDTLVINTDPRALEFVRAHSAQFQVVPMISNYYNNIWNGENVRRITRDPARRHVFIASVLRFLRTYHFQGVNIDFEEVNDNTDEHLVVFQQELYTALHAEGFIVTQDIAPLNEDYNLEQLQKYNDYLFVMAYDQHAATSEPGPIATHAWVENIIEQFSEKIPAEKLILCIAGYGYDWGPKGDGNDITYQEAISIAEESDATVDFDNDTYNLHYDYRDDKDQLHHVHFTDAATDFNAMRTADDYGWRGTALWRLGSEDPRLWTFYKKTLTVAALQKSRFDFSTVKSNLISDNIDYIGEGEVLDILSAPSDGKITIEYDAKEHLITEENYDSLPTSYVVRKFGKAVGKKVVLTFDDGPDPTYTPAIVDILEREHVPAAFFLVGMNVESNIPIVQRLFRDGFELGNHTFTHPNIAEISALQASVELNATRRLIESITGHSTILFRPPYNADAEPETRAEILPLLVGKEQNYLTIGESNDPRDWQEGITADSIVARVIREHEYGAMILLHDAGGNREATVEALPRIIKYFRDNGYEFTTIADLMGRKRDELMPLAERKEGLWTWFDGITARVVYTLLKFLYAVFVLGIVLSMAKMLTLAVLAMLQKRGERRNPTPPDFAPMVSILVPAYNESVNIVRTVASLLAQAYASEFEILVIDDGSSDDTYTKAAAAFADDARVRVLTKPNGGKASALNYGLETAAYEFVVCVDADTQFTPNSLAELVRPLHDTAVVAVAGNVRVGNTVNALTVWQSIEYITAQNFDRLALAYLNCITIVPGAIGAYRKAAVVEVGGLQSDTLAEDCDLTMRLLRSGGIVTYANKAVALTEAPETFRMFFKQRFRWCYGVMQCFWKHRDTAFNPRFGSLGWVAMPNILLFQMILPLFAPLADLFLIGSLTSFTNAGHILEYYFAFMGVDLAVAALAHYYQGASLWRLWWLLPQRIVYRPIMYFILFRAYLKALKGEFMHWGFLHRTGNVTIGEA